MQTGGIETQGDAAHQAGDDAPLVFQFSKSEAKGISSVLNANRLAMFAACIGTAATFKSGWDKKNNMRMAASLMGVYANAIEMIFSNKRQATLGELSLAQGNWESRDGMMQTTLEGKLPDQAKDEINTLVADASLPKGSLLIGYDKKHNQTTLSIAVDAFPDLQKHLQEQLMRRQEAVAVLLDPGRRQENIRGDGNVVLEGIKLDGLPPQSIHTLRGMLKNDFDIDSDIHIENGRHLLAIAKEDQFKLNVVATPDIQGHERHMRVKSSHENETYAPGFIETLTRPDIHPKQHGILIGAIASNALRVGAGFKAEKMKNGGIQTSPFESYSSIWSMLTYLIDFMPEAKHKNGHVVAGVQSNYTGLEGTLHRVGEYLNERPLLASMAIKGPTVAMRLRDAYAPGKDDTPKKIGAAMDAFRAIVTSAIQKSDYGR